MSRIIGLSFGDPAGVSAEIVPAALAGLPVDARVRVYGPAPSVDTLAGRFPGRVEPVATTPDLDGVTIGRYSPASGRASMRALDAGVADLASGAVAALVTGPICKTALADAGLQFPGQTELVAHAFGCSRFAMMLAGPRLRVVLATTHLALRDVPAAVTGDAVFDAGDLVAAFLQEHMGIARPRLAVLGLNPHASDNGRFGDEEARVIAPAVARLVAAGRDASGPLPADTAFPRAATGGYDAVVAMYHDQGLGPLKLLHFHDAINVTLGLPRPRCAPDHGPAFDIAGRGVADPTSLSEAVRFALRV